MKETNNVILTPLVSLDTPGKATVEVVILADPVRYSCCTSTIHTVHCIAFFCYTLLPYSV